MHRTMSEPYQRFQQEVEGVLARFRTLLGGIALWDRSAWWQALIERGWQAAGWPHSEGGPDWDATQRHIWYSCCRRQWIDFVEPVELATLGPLLGKAGSDDTHAELRSDILMGRAPAALAPPEGDRLVLRDNVLSGALSFVPDIERARWLLAPCVNTQDKAQTGGFVLLSVDRVRWTQAQSTWGENGGKVEVDRLVLEPGQFFAPGRSAEGQQWARSVLLENLLQAAATGMSEDDTGLKTRHAALCIGVQAYQGLEQRWVWAQAQGLPLPFPAALLTLKAQQLQEQIGDLLVDTFGYYAVPLPQVGSGSNEPEMGPPGAQAAIANWFKVNGGALSARQALDLYGLVAHNAWGDAPRERNQKK